MRVHEVHVERLLGQRFRDANGQSVGRLEELIAEVVDGEYVVTELHVGGSALLERIAGFITQLPFFGWVPYAQRGYRVPWQLVDLTDPRSPTVTVSRDRLEPLIAGHGDA